LLQEPGEPSPPVIAQLKAGSRYHPRSAGAVPEFLAFADRYCAARHDL
jgi:hypothetical protein